MKKILFLLLISVTVFSGCKLMTGRSGKKGSDTLEVYAFNLEQKLVAQEQVHQITLNQLKKDSQAKIDSIKNHYESGSASEGKSYSSASTGTFYLIVGSFTTPTYASNWSAKVGQMGYQTEIVKASHWNLVSAESATNLRTALDKLPAVRSNVSVNAWVYVAR